MIDVLIYVLPLFHQHATPTRLNLRHHPPTELEPAPVSRKQSVPPKPPEQVILSVELSVVELSALSFVAMICTSAVEQVVANAADRGHRKIREAAKKHPKLPPIVR